MNPLTLRLRTDTGDVNSHHFCEIPIIGPGAANRLVMITGIAITSRGESIGLDVFQDDPVVAEVQITTDYHLSEHDKWLQNADEDLSAATYVSLAGVSADDEDAPGTPTGFLFAINDIKTQINEEDARRVVINIQAAVRGDAGIRQIAYQVNLVIEKAVQ